MMMQPFGHGKKQKRKGPEHFGKLRWLGGGVLMEKDKKARKLLPWGAIGISLLGTLVAAAFPVLFLYFQNADEAHFSDIAKPLACFLGIAAALYFVCLLLTKKPMKAGICAMIPLLVLLNYAFVEKGIRYFVPVLRYWHILPICIFLLLHIGYFVWKKLPDDLAGTIMPVLCLVFCGLLLFNGTTAVPVILDRQQAERESAQETPETVTGSGKTMPNIYYLLFDEYSSNAFMEKYFNYDNSNFTNGLEKKGFNVSYTSHNESIITSTIMTNIVNLDYVVDNTWPEYDKQQMREQGTLFSVLRENGYTVSATNGDFYGLPTIMEGNADNSSKTADGKKISDMLYEKTVVYPFLTKEIGSIRTEVDAVIRFSEEKRSNRMLMAHFNVPHAPFVYDENGNYNKTIVRDWDDLSYYKAQYIYTTKLMDEIVNHILENDPDSIIVLQSDHGARASTSQLFMEIFALEDMNNCFNAVYFLDEELDIQGLSGVNTWRIVLNRLLPANYPIVEVPIDTFKYR